MAMEPEMRCHWLLLDGEAILIPGCYGAMTGSVAACVCSYDDSELVVADQRAQKLLEHNRGIPGAAEALALLWRLEAR